MKQILMYSGGMDSVCAAHTNPKADLVYVDYGGKYCHKELKHIQEAARTLGKHVNVVSNRINLSELEIGESAFLPNRNALLILTAVTCWANDFYADCDDTEYGIILNATASGIHTDKDETFAELMSQLLTHMNRGTDRFKGKTYKVLLPTHHMTKPMIVKHYLDHKGPTGALIQSVSCYDPEFRQCGQCRSCLRKYFALVSNGVQTYSLKPIREVLEKVKQSCIDQTWCNNQDEMSTTLQVIEEILCQPAPDA